jgi:cytochrome c6
MSTKAMILSAVVALAAVSTLKAQQPADSSAAIYAKSCAMCHGPQGTPKATMAGQMTDFANAQTMSTVADSVMRRILTDGKGRIMPAFKTRLSAEQINGLVRYIRTLSRH